MKAVPTGVDGLVVLEPTVHGDERGFFMETFHEKMFANLGLPTHFAQDNHSRSSKGVLRGLHFQDPNAQGKLVRVVTGAVWDVAVDLRTGSSTFGRWFGTELTSENKRLVYVPPGFAHGFCVLSDTADFLYKCTTIYSPKDEHGIRWDDPDLNITWPVDRPQVSAKDASWPLLKDYKASRA